MKRGFRNGLEKMLERTLFRRGFSFFQFSIIISIIFSSLIIVYHNVVDIYITGSYIIPMQILGLIFTMAHYWCAIEGQPLPSIIFLF